MPKEYDPPMHSAEHILNQTMVRMFACGRSINAHIEPKKSRIDYRFSRNLTPEEIAGVEAAVNGVIDSNLKVSEEFITREQAAESFNLKRLPDDAGDTIRIIRIGGYDACPCSGKHVSTTREIGSFKILSSSHENDVLRLRFKLIRGSGETSGGEA
jgi:misacylated tRNA(Ala) deacylase